jgi:CheY-like chemotaxis protein
MGLFQGGSMYSILIADDEKYVRQDIIRSVNWTDHGYFIVGEASNGAQALEKIKELQPDVLITDIRMPLTDGLSLIERALKLQPNLHSVIVSGYEDFHYAREAIRLNVLDYLTKPIDETSILSMLKKLTSVYGMLETTNLRWAAIPQPVVFIRGNRLGRGPSSPISLVRPLRNCTCNLTLIIAVTTTIIMPMRLWATAQTILTRNQ